jgi:hypothetical protein
VTSAISSACGSSPHHSAASSSGSANVGDSVGSAPTSVTPCSSARLSIAIAIAPTSTASGTSRPISTARGRPSRAASQGCAWRRVNHSSATAPRP